MEEISLKTKIGTKIVTTQLHRLIAMLALCMGSLLMLFGASPTFAATTGQWSFCANENGYCAFTGTQTVRYGAGNNFVQKSLAWNATCNNATFGDPAPGQAKRCEVTNSWSFCANENGQCGFAGTQTVRYGSGSTFNAKVLSAATGCNNGVFGDPTPGVAKHCDVAPTTWTRCASEGQQCAFSGTKPILYGANGSFVVRTLTNGTACTNAIFGDPISGVTKHCYVPGEPINDTTGNNGPWNGLTTFNLVNGTNGAYPDSQIYWAIVGRDVNTNQFVRVALNGSFVPMTPADNGALTKNGETYTNYFHTLAQSKQVTIPTLRSARLFLSVGSPMYIRVNQDVNGNIGYAGANIQNPTDPNIDVYFDFVEMSLEPNLGFFGNTTRVDHFGFPVTLRLQGMDGYDQTVGETESRASLFSKFVAEVPSQFKSLAQTPYAPYRIVAPAHATFRPGQPNANYLQGYIDQVWNKYTSQTLTFTNQQGTFTGQVVNGQFTFSDGQGTYRVNKPSTTEVLLGNGALNDPTGTTPGPVYDKQLQIQAQLCAAFNRHVVENPAQWGNSAFFYPAGQVANYYAKFWHDHSLGALAYGFAYDDVWNYSSSVHTTKPTIATVTIRW
jgi:hypothetical protein